MTAKIKMFPIRLLKNYRPMDEFKVIERADPDDPESPMIERDPKGEKEKVDGRGKVYEVASMDYSKVPKNSIIKVPVEEAKRAVALRIAERADAIA